MKIIKFLCFYKFAYHVFAVNCQRRLSYPFENNTKCSRSRAECLLMHGRMSHVMIRLEVGHLIIPNDFANTKNVRELIPPLHRSTKWNVRWRDISLYGLKYQNADNPGIFVSLVRRWTFAFVSNYQVSRFLGWLIYYSRPWLERKRNEHNGQPGPWHRILQTHVYTCESVKSCRSLQDLRALIDRRGKWVSRCH